MQIFRDTNYNFIGNKKKAFILSGLLVALTVVSLVVPIHPDRGFGPNMSIDFVGGTVVQLKFEKPVLDDLAQLRTLVSDLGYGKPEVKTVGREEHNEVQIIVKRQKEGTLVADEIRGALAKGYAGNPFEIRRLEKVGPKVGGELAEKAVWSILFSLLAIVIYIAVRFHLPFGIAAIVALFHDVVIVIGVFSFLNAEISLPVVAALLTIVGYSLNDTIVVFDRIRENLTGSLVKKSSFLR